MRADLHVHTNFSSDCNSTPEEVVDAAIEKGLSYIVIADHDTTEGAEKARAYSEGKGIGVIVGQEISCKDGTVIAVNIKKEMPIGISVYEAVYRIHKQGGFAIAAPNVGFKAFTLDFDAVEVMTGESYNFGEEKWMQRLCKMYDMPMVATSNAHHVENIGCCGIEFSGDLFETLVSGRFKMFGSKVIFHTLLFQRIKYILRPFAEKKISKKVISNVKQSRSEKKERAEERF